MACSVCEMGDAQSSILTEFLPQFDRAFGALQPDESGAGAGPYARPDEDVKSEARSVRAPSERDGEGEDEEEDCDEASHPDAPGQDQKSDTSERRSRSAVW